MGAGRDRPGNDGFPSWMRRVARQETFIQARYQLPGGVRLHDTARRYAFPVAAMQPGDGPAIIMEVRSAGEKPHLERIPLPTDRPMFVETLVQEAKIHERLGGVNMSIMRPTGPNLPPVRMDVRVKDTGKVKDMEQNYALMPGDHIIVTYDQRTSLEVFVDSIRGT